MLVYSDLNHIQCMITRARGEEFSTKTTSKVKLIYILRNKKRENKKKLNLSLKVSQDYKK